MPPLLREYVVRSRRAETPTTTTLELSYPDGALPSWKAGQCLTIYFPDLSPTLGKLYSISSAPFEQRLMLTVKRIGRFSNRLCALLPHSTLLATEPHGSFVLKGNRGSILLAGGMGVTPMRSMALEAVHAGDLVGLLYSARQSDDMPFCSELSELSARAEGFFFERFVTRGTTLPAGAHPRRMRVDDITRILERIPQAHFLVSGSIPFVLSQRTALIDAGVGREDILTEAYF